MKRKAKGQSAMEYLMTYGWAILIVVIVIAALWTMGVFQVSPTVPCSPCFSNFAFIDYANGTLMIRNGPRAITLTSVTGGTIPNTTSYSAGDDITITGIATSGDIAMSIVYNVTASGLSHTDTATIHNS